MSGPGSRPDDFVTLGHICGVHGVQGWVKVHSWTDPREAILDYQPWYVGEDRRPVNIVAGRKQGKGIVAGLPDVNDRETARQWMNVQIAVPRHQMPEPPSGSYYWSDLVGLAVETTGGVALGTVKSLLETGAHDVLVLGGEKERLIPFVPETYVKNVDLVDGLIVVDWDPDF